MRMRSFALLLFCVATASAETLANKAEWQACAKSNGTACGYCTNGRAGPRTCLQLDSLGLTGPIPPADLARMTGLTKLSLGGNCLTGTIPKEIGALTNLIELSLSSQLDPRTFQPTLTGPMPREIGLLTKLIHLTLEGNALTGLIPGEYGSLTKLTIFDVQSNLIIGAESGICGIVGNSWPVPTRCNINSNKAWTNGALCPACLNTGSCKPPVACTES